MKAIQQFDYNQSRWNRNILSILGLVVLLSTAVECYILFVFAEDRSQYFCHFVLVPTLFHLAVYAAAAAAVRGLAKHQEYILLSAATLMADILIVIHSPVYYLLVTLHLPVLLSLIYFQRAKLLYAILNSFISLVSIFLFDRNLWHEVNNEHLIGISLILLLFCGIAYFTLMRGREIYDYYSSRQDDEHRRIIDSYLEELRSKTDPLTGSYNHSSFHAHLEQIVRQSDAGLFLFYLAFIDLDEFKELNERFGYRQGDEVLRSIAETISSRLGPHDLLARFEGDKFAVQSFHYTSQEAFDAMESIRKRIERAEYPGLDGERVTVSIGIVPYSMGLGKTALLINADLALAEAKSKGKNRTAISSSLLGADRIVT